MRDIYIVYGIIFVLGLLFGSFLNVCIYRIPNGESVAFPPSHCPKCNTNIKPYDNIPIISYLILKGKCRNCGIKISMRYPVVELITALLFTGVFFKYGLTFTALKLSFMVLILVTLSGIDYDTYTLPDRLTFALVVLGILLSGSIKGLESSFMGAAIYSFPFWMLYGFGESVLKKEIMGFGDVKLAAGIGAFLGYSGFYDFYLFFMLSFVIGAVVSLLLIAFKIRKREELVPFGPFIAISAYVVMMIN